MSNAIHRVILQIFNFSIEHALENYYRKNNVDIKLFFILFIVAMIGYGQGLFFYSLSSDDFARYYSSGEEQASWLGRWMAGIFNQYIFTGSLHILPYLNTLIGVFCFTLAGYISAKFLALTRPLHVSIFTLLVVFFPYGCSQLILQFKHINLDHYLTGRHCNYQFLQG